MKKVDEPRDGHTDPSCIVKIECEVIEHPAEKVEKSGPKLPACGEKHKRGDKAHPNNCGKVATSRATGKEFAENGTCSLVVYTDLLCSDPKLNLSHEDNESVHPKIYHHGGTKKH